MAKHKYIYWRPDMKGDDKGNSFVNVHILVGYNQASIFDLQTMADELRKTFPQATYEEIRAGKVTRSRSFSGFTIVTWNGYIPKKEYPGWLEFSDRTNAEYSW